jgi:hypothetical protein
MATVDCLEVVSSEFIGAKRSAPKAHAPALPKAMGSTPEKCLA